MATTITEVATAVKSHVEQSKAPVHKEPLKLSGVLDNVEQFDVTPIIGREFPTVNLKEWLEAPNSDELIKELAITSESHDEFACKRAPG